jgi:protein TonB
MTRRKSNTKNWAVVIGVLVLAVSASAFAVKTLFTSDDGARHQRAIQTVTLLKPPPTPPPPPPKMKEKPPEPEPVVKKEQIVEQRFVDKPELADKPQQQQSPDDKPGPPAGDLLGLDAVGGPGSGDGFGLAARQGGAALIGGQGGGGGGGVYNPMRKYAPYVAIVQDDIRRLIHEHMKNNGGVPDASCKVTVQIKLNDQGYIVGYQISEPCGNRQMDEAVDKVLRSAKISEPPPSEMPRSIKIRISAKG